MTSSNPQQHESLHKEEVDKGGEWISYENNASEQLQRDVLQVLMELESTFFLSDHESSKKGRFTSKVIELSHEVVDRAKEVYKKVYEQMNLEKEKQLSWNKRKCDEKIAVCRMAGQIDKTNRNMLTHIRINETAKNCKENYTQNLDKVSLSLEEQVKATKQSQEENRLLKSKAGLLEERLQDLSDELFKCRSLLASTTTAKELVEHTLKERQRDLVERTKIELDRLARLNQLEQQIPLLEKKISHGEKELKESREKVLQLETKSSMFLLQRRRFRDTIEDLENQLKGYKERKLFTPFKTRPTSTFSNVQQQSIDESDAFEKQEIINELNSEIESLKTVLESLRKKNEDLTENVAIALKQRDLYKSMLNGTNICKLMNNNTVQSVSKDELKMVQTKRLKPASNQQNVINSAKNLHPCEKTLLSKRSRADIIVNYSEDNFFPSLRTTVFQNDEKLSVANNQFWMEDNMANKSAPVHRRQFSGSLESVIYRRKSTL